MSGIPNAHAGLRRALATLGVDRIRRAFPRAFADEQSERAGKNAPAASTAFVVRVPSGTRNAVIQALRVRSDVVYAEPNYRLIPMGTPNDASFRSEWNMQNIKQSPGGYVGADVKAWAAWDRVTGNTGGLIGIVGEGGNVKAHTEFGSRLSGTIGSPSDDDHATQVAGIAAATGNNGQGIAGMDWLCGVRSDGGSTGLSDAADEMTTAVNNGVRILNNSWGLAVGTPWSIPFAKALTYAYNNGSVVVFGMPNDQAPGDYPSNYFDGDASINVTASGTYGYKASYSIARAWVDVSAPGGETGVPYSIYTTSGTNQYNSVFGTSYAVPHVAGAASLLRGYAQTLGTTLSPEDVEEVLKASAEDYEGTGTFDNYEGYGRINVRRAMDYMSQPGGLKHESVTGGTVVSQWTEFQQMTVYAPEIGVNGPFVLGKQYTIERTVNPTYQGSGNTLRFWTRPSNSTGWNGATAQYGLRYCLRVGSSNTLRMFIYELRSLAGVPLGWYPSDRANAVFSWSTLRYNRQTLTGNSISTANSYFVPQIEDSTNPLEGAAAVPYFRTCPNNDGTQTLGHNARLKVVIKDTAGFPIANVSATDIYVVLNGGTAAQGFLGSGADSIVANSMYNPVAQCPNVWTIPADAPTDANGVTYITLKGATPGSPGVATRDPNRKWGHYDSEMPVYFKNLQLQGRFTSGDVNNSYKLLIKNFDLLDGLGTDLNVGEAVTAGDYNDVAAHGGQLDSADPLNWWRDFDSSGSVSIGDINLIGPHVNHGCNSPSNP